MVLRKSQELNSVINQYMRDPSVKNKRRMEKKRTELNQIIEEGQKNYDRKANSFDSL